MSQKLWLRRPVPAVLGPGLGPGLAGQPQSATATRPPPSQPRSVPTPATQRAGRGGWAGYSECRTDRQLAFLTYQERPAFCLVEIQLQLQPALGALRNLKSCSGGGPRQCVCAALAAQRAQLRRQAGPVLCASRLERSYARIVGLTAFAIGGSPLRAERGHDDFCGFPHRIKLCLPVGDCKII